VIIERDLWAQLSISLECEWLDFVSIDPGETTGMRAGSVLVTGLQLGGSTVFASGGMEAVVGEGLHVPVPYGSDASLFMAESEAATTIVRNVWQSFEEMRSSGSSVCRAVVCEDFVLRERTAARNLLSPVRLTSMIMDRLHARKTPVHVAMQSASDAKSAVPDSQLKRRGLYAPGMVHANDATRHAVLFLRKVQVK
jgi:hypothetical protein